MARYDDLNTSMIGYATLLSALLLVVVIVGVEALCYYLVNSESARKADSREYTTSLNIQSEQRKSLSGYERVPVPAPEPAPGEKPATPTTRIQIPIEKAMEIILKEQGASAPTGG
jgi:hypothetical protein